jgi:RNA methyltransferase, TrmH family
LDGVGNPHNLGAILRSAAHFGIAAMLLPKHSALALSGAAARVAEGAAEQVPFVRLGREDNAIAQLHGAGFQLAATLVRDGGDLFATALPQRLVYVIGAEGAGMNAQLAAACDLRLSIPGSGAVESLNVAAATAVLLAEWRRNAGGRALS